MILAAQNAGERLSYRFREEHESSGQFCVSYRGLDVLVSLPTESGKSLCYSCLPWLKTSDEHVRQVSLEQYHWHSHGQSGLKKTALFVPAHVTMLLLFHKLFILYHMTTLVIEITHETRKVA